MIKYILVALLAAVTLAGDMPQDPFEPEERIIKNEIEMIEEDMEHHDMDNKENFFDMIKWDMNHMFAEITNLTYEYLEINCTAAKCGWNDEKNRTLGLMKDDFCKGSHETTDSTQSVMGAECKRAFNFTDTGSCESDTSSAKEDCACIPCKVMTYMYEDIPMRLLILREVGKKGTLEGLVQWAMETIAPISPDMIQQCGSRLIDSIKTCSKNYDGKEEDIRKMLKWFNSRKLKTDFLFESLDGLLSAYLGEPITTDGTSRPYELHGMVVSLAKMVDDSMNTDTCSKNNMRRMSGTIFTIFDKLQIATGINDYVEAVLMLPHSFWCKPHNMTELMDFQMYMQEKFNGKCAYRGLLDRINMDKKTPIHKLMKFVNSVMKKKGISERLGPILTKKILRSMDPLKVCFWRCHSARMTKKEKKKCKKEMKEESEKSGYKEMCNKNM